jgi:hypothetical protein
MTFFLILNSWSRLKNSAPRFALAVGLLLSGVIMGCGGGGGGSSPSAPDSGSSSGSGSVTPASLISLGVYTTTIANTSGNKALTLIINSDSASSANGRFYALQFNSSANQVQQPDIFSGSIAGIGTTTASISSLKEFSTDSNTFKSGSATFTYPTQEELKVEVIQSGNTINWSNANGVTLESTASSNSLIGTWTGNLYHPTGVLNPNFSITFTRAISNSDNLSFDLQFSTFNSLPACRIINSSGIASPSPSGVNLYNLTMDLANATGCHLTADSQVPISFSGVAYVTTSPVEGKKRLQWVATTTSDGRGLSFRADR